MYNENMCAKYTLYISGKNDDYKYEFDNLKEYFEFGFNRPPINWDVSPPECTYNGKTIKFTNCNYRPTRDYKQAIDYSVMNHFYLGDKKVATFEFYEADILFSCVLPKQIKYSELVIKGVKWINDYQFESSIADTKVVMSMTASPSVQDEHNILYFKIPVNGIEQLFAKSINPEYFSVVAGSISTGSMRCAIVGDIRMNEIPVNIYCSGAPRAMETSFKLVSKPLANTQGISIYSINSPCFVYFDEKIIPFDAIKEGYKYDVFELNSKSYVAIAGKK